MTPRIPVWPYRKVKRLLEGHGFQVVGQRGSHVYFEDHHGRRVTVPRHDGRNVSRGILRQILADAGIDPDTVRR